MLGTAVTPAITAKSASPPSRAAITTGPPLTYTGWTSSPSAANRPNSLAMLTGNEVFQEGDGYATLIVFAVASPTTSQCKTNIDETRARKTFFIIEPKLNGAFGQVPEKIPCFDGLSMNGI